MYHNIFIFFLFSSIVSISMNITFSSSNAQTNMKIEDFFLCSISSLSCAFFYHYAANFFSFARFCIFFHCLRFPSIHALLFYHIICARYISAFPSFHLNRFLCYAIHICNRESNVRSTNVLQNYMHTHEALYSMYLIHGVMIIIPQLYMQRNLLCGICWNTFYIFFCDSNLQHVNLIGHIIIKVEKN